MMIPTRKLVMVSATCRFEGAALVSNPVLFRDHEARDEFSKLEWVLNSADMQEDAGRWLDAVEEFIQDGRRYRIMILDDGPGESSITS